MSNPSDKEIDRLSREAADSYEPDHSSLSWSRLEQKLTEQMPGRPPDGIRFGRVNPYVWGPAAVLIAGLSFLLIKNIIYSPHSTRTKTTAVQTGSSTVGNKTAAENALHTDSLSMGISGRSVNSLSTISSKKNTSGKDLSIAETNLSKKPFAQAGTKDLKESSFLREPDASNDSRRNSDSREQGPGSKYPVPISAARTSMSMNGSTPAGNPSSNKAVKSTVEINAAKNAEQSNQESDMAGTKSPLTLPLPATSGGALGKVKGNDSLMNSLAKSNAPVPYKSLRINRSLNFGIAFGPDYSNAGGITNNQISNNIGITIGYYLTSKLSLNTGILYSNKFYWAPGKSGNIQSVRPAAAPTIEYVNGACNMYEIPVTLRYDFASNEKTRFFVNAGLSSYLMVKQTYIYFFHDQGRLQAYETFNDHQQNYWFGVADLSLGMETDMGKGFTFQAEPFLKLPLQSMGVENLKINSVGFLLSFRYSPVLSRSKK